MMKVCTQSLLLGTPQARGGGGRASPPFFPSAKTTFECTDGMAD
jgi:hypothetical protein